MGIEFGSGFFSVLPYGEELIATEPFLAGDIEVNRPISPYEKPEINLKGLKLNTGVTVTANIPISSSLLRRCAMVEPENMTVIWYAEHEAMKRWHKNSRTRKKWLKRFGTKPELIKYVGRINTLTIDGDECNFDLKDFRQELTQLQKRKGYVVFT